MKKALKIFFGGLCALFLLVLILLIVDISNDNEKANNTEEPQTEAKKVDAEEFKAYASNIMGKTFVKEFALVNNKSDITFYSNFEDFKSENPDSLLTIEDYTGYFETGEAIEKILVIENVRLLRQFPALEGAKMTLPYNGKTYSIEMDRKSVNDYLGFNIEGLNAEDESWQKKFLEPIGYDEEKRNRFFNEFGKVE